MTLASPDPVALRAYLQGALAADKAEAIRKWLIVAATPEVLAMLDDMVAEMEHARARLAYWADQPLRARLARLAWRARCVIGHSFELDLEHRAPLAGTLGGQRAEVRASGLRRKLTTSPGEAREVLVSLAEATWFGVYAVERSGLLIVLAPGTNRHAASDRIEAGGLVMEIDDVSLDVFVVFDPRGPLPEAPPNATAAWLASLLDPAEANGTTPKRSVLWTTLEVTGGEPPTDPQERLPVSRDLGTEPVIETIASLPKEHTAVHAVLDEPVNIGRDGSGQELRGTMSDRSGADISQILDVAVCRTEPHGILVATEVGQVHLLHTPSGPIEKTWHCHGGRGLQVGWVGGYPIAWNADATSHSLWALRPNGSTTAHNIPTHADIAPTEDGFFVACNAVRLAFHDLAPDGSTSREQRNVESPGSYRVGTLSASMTGAVSIGSAQVFQIQTRPGRWWQTVNGGADCFAFSPSGRWLAVSSFNPDASYLYCYRVTDHEVTLETTYAVRALPERIARLVWSDDEQRIAMYAREGDVRVFERSGWVPGLWTSSVVAPAFYRDRIITVPDSRDRLLLHVLNGAPQTIWIRLRTTTPATFDITGNAAMHRGDKIVTFERRPRIRPTAIYEVVTGPRKDDNTHGQTAGAVLARLRLGLPQPSDTSLDADQANLDAVGAHDGQFAALRPMRALLERLYANHPTKLEQLRSYLATSGVTAAAPTPNDEAPNLIQLETPVSARRDISHRAAPDAGSVASQHDEDLEEKAGDRVKPLISARDMQIIEDVLQLRTGYVLNFSDRTMREFFADEVDIDIDDERYMIGGTSKAKRLRTFLRVAEPPLLGQVLEKLLEHRLLYNTEISPEVQAHYRALANRLGGGTAVPVPQAVATHSSIPMTSPTAAVRATDPISAATALGTSFGSWSGSIYGTGSTQELVSMGGAVGDTEQALDKRLAGSTSKDPMSNLTPEQQRVVDAVLTVLLEQPGSGRQWVSGSELRFALKDLERQHRDDVIQSCMPRLLVTPGQDDSYQPTLDGLLEAADPRTTRALEIALRLIADRYVQAGGRRQRALLWSDVRKQGAFERGDFDVVWHTLTLGQVARAGRPPAGASDNPRSPRYDYEFWLREQDLELIYENRDVHAWAAVQRARIAAMNQPRDASSSSPRSVLTETSKLPASVHSQTAIDIGIVIALPEEVQQLLTLVPSYTRHPATDIDAYCFRRSRYRCAVILVGEMGETQAGVFTERLIGELNPSIIVSMGIAGGLNDLCLGDVHVPPQSVQYVQDSKATPSATESFAVLPGAPAYRADFALLRAARAFQFDHPTQFAKWTDDAAQDLAALIPDAARRQVLIDAAHVRASARLLADGHVATGPTVGAAQAFSDWIRSHNRNVKSLEMESAAVLLAAQTRTDPKRALVIRAISDFGDERKKELDTKADGVLRRYSMRNAVRLLWALLDADTLPLNPR